MVSELSRTLQDGYVSYGWERRMREFLSVPFSSSFLSILLLPKASDQGASHYNDLEDTLARANAWLNASQVSGVPIVFMNVQTESLLTKGPFLKKNHLVSPLGRKISWRLMTCLYPLHCGNRKISGKTGSSTVNAGPLSGLSNLPNASLYGFEDYHGVDIGVVRAVRLWYASLGGEFAIEIKLREDDTKLGFAISRTEEGFLFISSVIDDDENLPSTRSGLKRLYKEASNSSSLLVVSRVANQKVLPWIVSSIGAIRCFDTVSISQKLSMHRHAKVPITIHVLLWDRACAFPSDSNMSRAATPSVLPLPSKDQLSRRLDEDLMQLMLPEFPNESGVVDDGEETDGDRVQLLPPEVPNESSVVDDGLEIRLERDTAGGILL